MSIFWTRFFSTSIFWTRFSNICLIFQLKICFSKSENSKFRQMGKCQKFDTCTLTNLKNMNPIMSRLYSYWKRMGLFSNIVECPLKGHYETCDVKLDTNLLTFLPKGVLLNTIKYYNDENQLVLNMSMVLVNN